MNVVVDHTSGSSLDCNGYYSICVNERTVTEESDLNFAIADLSLTEKWNAIYRWFDSVYPMLQFIKRSFYMRTVSTLTICYLNLLYCM